MDPATLFMPMPIPKTTLATQMVITEVQTEMENHVKKDIIALITSIIFRPIRSISRTAIKGPIILPNSCAEPSHESSLMVKENSWLVCNFSNEEATQP